MHKCAKWITPFTLSKYYHVTRFVMNSKRRKSLSKLVAKIRHETMFYGLYD